MKAGNYSELRKNLKTYMDRVCEDREVLIVTRKDDQNVVMISMDEYSSLVETDYLLSNESNARHLRESLTAARQGKVTARDLFED